MLEAAQGWAYQNLGQWYYVLGYTIVLTWHNWPLVVALVMSFSASLRLYRQPSQSRALGLYGWLMLGLAYEYSKHIAPELHLALDFLLIGDLSRLNSLAHLVIGPLLTGLLYGSSAACLLGATLSYNAGRGPERSGKPRPGGAPLEETSASARHAPMGEAMDSTGHTDCTIIIPTYNERENIEGLLPQILAFSRFAVLVVDDNSPDGTGQFVAEQARVQPRVRLLSRGSKQGLGSAYLAGFRAALEGGAQYIFEMDADFSHNPHYLPQLLAAAEQDTDLVIGSRYVRGGGTTDWGLIRQAVSRGGNTYARLILGLRVRDCTGGFRCYRRSVLETLDLDSVHSNGYGFQIEMAYRTHRAGFRISEIPIIFPDRRVGASKMSLPIVLEALVNVWRLRLTAGRQPSVAARRATHPS